MLGGSIVNEWDQVVRHLSVSSNENQAHRLTDGNDSTYWQSSGPQGKVQSSNIISQMSVILLLRYYIALDSIGDSTKNFNRTVVHPSVSS